MAKRIFVPLVTFSGDQWADLGALSVTHQICGETVTRKSENFSFIGGHRVRLYLFKKNVHFKVPPGQELNITDVVPAVAPRRQ